MHELTALPTAATRRLVLGAGTAWIVAVALVDWQLQPNISLGFLYLFALLPMGQHLGRPAIAAVALVCTILREAFSPFAWGAEATPRTLLVLAAFLGAGLFASELARNRRVALDYSSQLVEQMRLRQGAEEELRVLVDSSPAAILTADGAGSIVLANDTARGLLGFGDEEPLAGRRIQEFLPALASALGAGSTARLRTALECVGRKRDGEVFLAHVWFATYATAAGRRLAAIVLDGSEELRDREAAGMRETARTSRIVLGAVSHEVRNLAAAISVAHANLSQRSELAASDDFRALGSLVTGLERLAATDVRLGTDARPVPADLRDVLEELRVLLETPFREAGLSLCWTLPPDVPRVWGERHGLLQVFLNLAHNALAELRNVPGGRLRIEVRRVADRVEVCFADNGRGVPEPARLFHPFQEGSEVTGLGLYVARAIARSFAGELRYRRADTGGAVFTVELLVATAARQASA